MSTITVTETLPDLNWEAIRKDYESGRLTSFQIGAKYAVPAARIRKRAEREGWISKRMTPKAQLRTQVLKQAKAVVTAQACDMKRQSKAVADFTEQCLTDNKATRAKLLTALEAGSVSQDMTMPEFVTTLAALQKATRSALGLDQRQASQTNVQVNVGTMPGALAPPIEIVSAEDDPCSEDE